METTKSARLLRIAREALAKRAGAAEQEGGESGFTLIELMVVLLIMAILLAIAIPTFLGVKGGAQDRAAQSNLSNGLISSKAMYATNSSYLTPASMIAALGTQEPSLTFVAGATPQTAGNTVSLNSNNTGTGGGGELVMVAYSPANGGTCWAVADSDGTPTAITNTPSAAGTTYTAWKYATAACNSTAIPAGVSGLWKSQYPAGPLA
jgi:type IV pilus assembly protein PilA